mgnify:CR=1 FL=1
MWIIPKNYQLYSAFVPGMVASKEDLTLLESSIESSLMWRSKPTRLQTWLRRWNRVSWLQRLFTQTLKPSHQKSFETELTLSLAVIPVSPSQQQDCEKERKMNDICGRTLGDTYKQLDLPNVSLKTCKDISRLDSAQSSAIWKKMVTEQRLEYSQRVKLAQTIREKECSYWLTPQAADCKNMNTANQMMLSRQVKLFPTPCARDSRDDGDMQAAQKRQSPSISAMARRFPQEKEVSPTIGKVHDLNPDWVEQMMGLPTKLTDLGSWGTE